MKENKIDIAKLIIENMPQHTELRKRTIKTRLETQFCISVCDGIFFIIKSIISNYIFQPPFIFERKKMMCD